LPIGLIRPLECGCGIIGKGEIRMAPQGESSTRIKDLTRDLSQLELTANDLRKYLGPEMGGLNVKQTEGIITLLHAVRGIILALDALNKELSHISVDDRSLQIGIGSAELLFDKGGDVLLTAGDSSIRMRKDGTLDIKGNNIQIRGAGDIEIKAAKDLHFKGTKVL
jgi:hypothetical protein